MKNILKDKLFLIILFIALVIRIIFSVVIPAWQSPDEYPHYWVAKELAETGKLPVNKNEFPKYEAFQPPLYYLVLSIPIFLQNKSLTYTENIKTSSYNLILLRLISVLAGIISIIFSFLFCLNIYPDNRYVSLFSTAFISILPTYVGLSSTLNNDSFVILFSILSLYFASKQNPKISDSILSGVFGGLALFSKLNALPIYLISLYLLFKKRGRKSKNKFLFLLTYNLGWIIFLGILIYRDILFYDGILIIAPEKIKADSFSFNYFIWALRNLTWSFWLAFGRVYNIVPSMIIYIIFFLPITFLAFLGWFRNAIKKEKFLFLEIIGAVSIAVAASLYYTLSYKEGTMTSWGKNIYPVLPYCALFFVTGWKRISQYTLPIVCLLILFVWDLWALIRFVVK